MNAVVIAVGSELLTPGRRDTNADWLVERLLDLAIETVWRVAVDDDAPRIAGLVRDARRDAEVVLLTGGLGPTDDDRTREALALALDAPLERDAAMERHIASLFSARGRTAAPRQFVQAERPRGGAWISNPLGSAPGILVERDGVLLASLPGVPAEMKVMFSETVAPHLRRSGRGALARRTLRVAGRPESVVDDAVRDLYAAEGVTTTILASTGTVELLLLARGDGPAQARGRLHAVESEMRARLGEDLFGSDGDTLASVVGQLLSNGHRTLATAESCTGGLLGAALTDVPGASAWYRGGMVCYANDLKTSLAAVPGELLAAHGAVSEPVARALARGARHACGADFGLGVTGVAGPDGGTPDKPVGTVHIALDDGAEGRARKLDWPGDRDLIRRRAVASALDLLRRRLVER
jgi:nicotinamide-nucleotide amidase